MFNSAFVFLIRKASKILMDYFFVGIMHENDTQNPVPEVNNNSKLICRVYLLYHRNSAKKLIINASCVIY